MREILFRGKSVNNGEWYKGSLRIVTYQPADDSSFQQYEIEDTTCGVFPNDFMSGYCEMVDPATIGQFTGLCDKNGVRIYEGDICRNTRNGETVSVKWHGTLAGYVWSKRKSNSSLYDFGELFRAYDKYEVIGNIHDNPELLVDDNVRA